MLSSLKSGEGNWNRDEDAKKQRRNYKVVRYDLRQGEVGSKNRGTRREPFA